MLAILIVFVTNVIRRRRAKAFEREIVGPAQAPARPRPSSSIPRDHKCYSLVRTGASLRVEAVFICRLR